MYVWVMAASVVLPAVLLLLQSVLIASRACWLMLPVVPMLWVLSPVVDSCGVRLPDVTSSSISGALGLLFMLAILLRKRWPVRADLVMMLAVILQAIHWGGHDGGIAGMLLVGLSLVSVLWAWLHRRLLIDARTPAPWRRGWYVSAWRLLPLLLVPVLLFIFRLVSSPCDWFLSYQALIWWYVGVAQFALGWVILWMLRLRELGGLLQDGRAVPGPDFLLATLCVLITLACVAQIIIMPDSTLSKFMAMLVLVIPCMGIMWIIGALGPQSSASDAGRP